MALGILEKQAKNHTIPNAITDLSGALPASAYSVHLQPIRNIVVTIQVLDDDGSVIDTITGKTTNGSIHVDGNSMTRRTGAIQMVVDPEYLPKNGGLLWYNRRIRIFQGIVDMSRYPREPVNFLLGTFIVDEMDLSVDYSNSSISVKLSDKMTRYDEETLENELKLPADTPISVAMKKTMELIGETEFGHFHESEEGEVVPYEYTKGIGTKVVDIIKELRDMYMDYICGYNVKGEFEFRKIQIQKEIDVQDPKWRFDSTNHDRGDLTLSFKEGYNLKGVKNRVVVYGTTLKNGYTPKGEVRITDAKNPFNVDAVGVRTQVITNTKLSNDMQCVTEARYNIWKTAHFQEKCSISCVPLYLLDGGDIVEITNPVNRKTNRYMVDSFSINLGIDGEMGIEAHRLYYVGLEYGEAEMPLVNQIKKGINELGWLSLGEQRIKDCYGLSGSGKNTIVVRFVNNEVGGEQASVTGYLTTKKQTLELDLKDFENLDFKDENGSSGRSKGDYADRVLGHEMFHAVCNDYYGVDKTIDMPTWFKEGFGELLIGGRDRYTSIGGYDSVKQKKEGLIRKAKSILNGSWDSTSEDYVAANLIAAAIYYLVGADELRKGFVRLSQEDNVNLNFLLKFIPVAATNDEVKKKVLDKIATMSLWDRLNDISDEDVCSIGGIHMMNLYNVPLNAENIFNNQSAKTASIGFILSFD